METIYLVASGDLRLSANQKCEAAQAEMERQLIAAVEREGGAVKRAHPYDPVKQHGFIDSQKYGLEVFSRIPKDAPVIVAEAVWQYTHHVLPGPLEHRGPVLTVANWDGTWPGLVGMLNLNGSLTKAGRKYSTLWSEDFTDEFFVKGLRAWLKKGYVKPDTPHVRKFDPAEASGAAVKFGLKFRHTGYMVGVTSPFGTKKALPVYVEGTILSLPAIYINAGRKGLLVEMSPSELTRILKATPVRVAR